MCAHDTDTIYRKHSDSPCMDISTLSFYSSDKAATLDITVSDVEIFIAGFLLLH